jgi:hypothetical protein
MYSYYLLRFTLFYRKNIFTGEKMKLLLSTLLVLLSINSFAGSTFPITRLYSVTADTESEALELATEAIRGIKNASIKKVIIEGRRHQCTFRVRRENSERFIIIKGLNVSKEYDLRNGDLEPRAYYKASIKFKFMKCRNR